MKRRNLKYRIVAKHNVATTNHAHRDDFETRLVAGADSNAAFDDRSGYLLYGLDYTQRKALFLDSDEPLSAARQASLLYDWQRAHARHLLEVPFENLPRPGDAIGMAPTFILTPGRCGSTLLAKLLRALGASVAAEPDFFTNLATASAQAQEPEARHQRDALLRACVDSLRDVWGNAPYIKLRGSCASLGPDLRRVLPQAKFVFVFRERRAWARSHARAFGAQLDAMLSVLLQTVRAYDDLLAGGLQPTMIWYEDLCVDPLRALQTLSGLSLPDDAADVIREVMAQDAHADTPLSQAKLQHATLEKQPLAEFDEAWDAHKPVETLQRLQLLRLL